MFGGGGPPELKGDITQLEAARRRDDGDDYLAGLQPEKDGNIGRFVFVDRLPTVARAGLIRTIRFPLGDRCYFGRDRPSGRHHEVDSNWRDWSQDGHRAYELR